MSVVVKGRKDGAPREVRVHLASRESGLGEGTGIPAALGVMLMQKGKITAKGVLPPEGCVNAADFLALASEVMVAGARRRGGQSTTTIFFETIAADGSVTRMEL